MDRQNVIGRSSKLGHEVRTLIAFFERMLERVVSRVEQVLNVLNKDNLHMILRKIIHDEVDREQGVRVAS